MMVTRSTKKDLTEEDLYIIRNDKQLFPRKERIKIDKEFIESQKKILNKKYNKIKETDKQSAIDIKTTIDMLQKTLNLFDK